MKQSNRTTSPQAPSLEALACLPGLSPTTRLVLIGLATDPDAPFTRLARDLGVPRTTVRRALIAAEAADVIRRGPSTDNERGPILWVTS
jgi:DNA-binding MarR family transcriptional regulator